MAAGGASVLAVDPAAAKPLAIASIEVRLEAYRAEHLNGISLAIASATAEVNRRVVADAKAAGVLVSSASEPGAGDFTLPAVWREGPLTLAVATSGASPGLARMLCQQAGQALGPAAARLAEVLAELRPMVRQRLANDPQARRRLLADWADPRWLERCRTDGPDAVRAALRQCLDDASSQQE